MSSRLKKRDQYAGHRTKEERKKVVETVHCVYCSNLPLPLSDHNTNDVVSSRTIHHTLTATLTGFLQQKIKQKTRCHSNNTGKHTVDTLKKENVM